MLFLAAAQSRSWPGNAIGSLDWKDEPAEERGKSNTILDQTFTLSKFLVQSINFICSSILLAGDEESKKQCMKPSRNGLYSELSWRREPVELSGRTQPHSHH